VVFHDYLGSQHPAAVWVPSPEAILQTLDQQALAREPQSAAPLASSKAGNMPAALAFGISWFHHVILIDKIEDPHPPTRLWQAR
jgi:hypothetical protein